MKKLDETSWADGICIRAYGRRIGIRVNDRSVLEQVLDRLPFGWKPARSPVVDCLYSVLVSGAKGQSRIRRFNLLYAGATRLARTLDLEEMLTELEANLHSYVATTTERKMFFHAGVVGWRGRAIVVPGDNFSGKTSLVLALMRAGASYYSDEFAVMDGRGLVHPYASPLHIRGRGLGRPERCPVELMDGRVGKKPLPVGLIVVSHYERGARWQPQLLSPSRAALAMLSNAMSARLQPQATMAMLRKVVSQAPVLQGVRGEADEIVDSILNDVVKKNREVM